MADVAPSPAHRVWRVVAIIAVGFALGVAMGGAAQDTRSWAFPIPSALTIGLAAVGAASGAFALRSSLALRLLLSVALFLTGGLALTRFGVGPGIAFTVAPATMWASLSLRGDPLFVSGVRPLLVSAGLGIAVAAPRLYKPSSSFTLPLVLTVAVLAGAGVVMAFAPSGDRRPSPARFDLRVALGLAALTAMGFLVGFALRPLSEFFTASTSDGGLGLRITTNPLVLIAPTFFGLMGVVTARGLRGGRAVCIGLVGTCLALTLSIISPKFAPFASILVIPLALGLVLTPSARRTERAHEALPIVTLLITTLLGMPLAAGLVRGFTRPLLGAVPGIATATATNWGAVLGFYAALVLVVLLAHLAHAYEFGFAALDPDDERDPLPILRKGLAGLKTKS